MSTRFTALQSPSPTGAMDLSDRRKVLNDVIIPMAQAGFTFIRADEGATRSDEPDWQNVATNDVEWIQQWFDLKGIWFAAVAKKQHGWIADIDDVAACVSMGLDMGWLDGCFKVSTPGGGIHAYGLHDDTTNLLANLITVHAEPGNKKSKKVFELKLHNQCCAAPGTRRRWVPKKKDGDYVPEGVFHGMNRGLHPALLEWIKLHGEETGHYVEGRASAFPDRVWIEGAKERLLEHFGLEECSDPRSEEEKGGQVWIGILECPICGKVRNDSATAANFKIRIDRDSEISFWCNTCSEDIYEKMEEKLLEDDPEWQTWDEPLFEDELAKEKAIEEGVYDVEEIESVASPVFEPTPVRAPEDLDTGTYLGFSYQNTDTGNAERLVTLHGDKLRWVEEAQEWAVWDKERGWGFDRSNTAMHLTKDVVEELDKLATGGEDKALISHAKKSGSANSRRSMLTCASAEPKMVTNLNMWDKDPWELNVLNGVVNLRTLEFRERKPDDYFLRQAGTKYDLTAKCPLWDEAVNTWMCGDKALSIYLQCAVGISLTSLNTQTLFFNEGDGQNGKDTFFSAIHGVMGSYFASAAMSSFMAVRQAGREKRDDLAALAGAIRMVVAAESAEGGRLDEDVIKLVTGGGEITVRGNYAKHWLTYTPQWKLWMMSNHQPYISGTDWAIWRRVKRIPWRFSFKDSGRMDPEFGEKLKAEYPGILIWALTGLHTYLANKGMPDCQTVKEATEEMRRDMDSLGQFISEEVVFGNGMTTSSEILYVAYDRWCDRSGIRSKSKPVFIKEFKKRCTEVKDDRLLLDAAKREIRGSHKMTGGSIEGCALHYGNTADTALIPEDAVTA